jgi:hypothetical protein
MYQTAHVSIRPTYIMAMCGGAAAGICLARVRRLSSFIRRCLCVPVCCPPTIAVVADDAAAICSVLTCCAFPRRIRFQTFSIWDCKLSLHRRGVHQFYVSYGLSHGGTKRLWWQCPSIAKGCVQQCSPRFFPFQISSQTLHFKCGAETKS